MGTYVYWQKIEGWTLTREWSLPGILRYLHMHDISIYSCAQVEYHVQVESPIIMENSVTKRLTYFQNYTVLVYKEETSTVTSKFPGGEVMVAS